MIQVNDSKRVYRTDEDDEKMDGKFKGKAIFIQIFPVLSGAYDYRAVGDVWDGCLCESESG